MESNQKSQFDHKMMPDNFSKYGLVTPDSLYHQWIEQISFGGAHPNDQTHRQKEATESFPNETLQIALLQIT